MACCLGPPLTSWNTLCAGVLSPLTSAVRRRALRMGEAVTRSGTALVELDVKPRSSFFHTVLTAEVSCFIFLLCPHLRQFQIFEC